MTLNNLIGKTLEKITKLDNLSATAFKFGKIRSFNKEILPGQADEKIFHNFLINNPIKTFGY